MLEAIEKRDEVEATKNKLEAKKKGDAASLDKLSAGKSTMKTMFKGASGKQNEITNLQNNIAQTERDADNYDIIAKMATTYLGDTVIPEFKGKKMGTYYKILKQYTQLEIQN